MIPRWLSRMLPFGNDDEPDVDPELLEVQASLDESERRITEGERRIIEALGVQADVWQRGR